MKTVYWIIGAVILICVIVFIVFFVIRSNGSRLIKTTKVTITDSCSVEKHRADSLQLALNDCLGVSKPLTLEEQVTQLQNDLANLKNQPKTTTVRTGTGNKQKSSKQKTSVDVVESTFSSNFVSQPTSTKVTTTTFASDGGSTPITLYEGGTPDNFGVTISGTGHVLFYIKNSVWVAAMPANSVPILYSENGPQLTLDQGQGVWFYESDRLASVQEINNWSYPVDWCLYMGQVHYGSVTYPAYFPHQVLKPLINKIRGKEWGEITNSDLAKMRIENSNIWTPNAEGTLMPFRENESNGKAYGKEDNNLYVGWRLHNRIYGKKKTTIE